MNVSQEYIRENSTKSFVFPHYNDAHAYTLLAVQCIGTVTNWISAEIWLNQLKARSGAFFLGFLSLADGLFCLLMIIAKLSSLIKVAECSSIVTRLVNESVAAGSRILTIAIVVQRWLAISRPRSMKRLCTSRQQVSVLLAIFLFMLGLLVFIGFYARLYYDYCQGSDDTDENYFKKIRIIYRVFYISCHAIVVFLLIVFNSLLLYSTFTMSQPKTACKSRDRQRHLELHISVIVLCLSAFSLLEFVFLVVKNVSDLGDAKLETDIRSVEMVFHWMYTINSSMNFFFYVSFGREFRGQLLSLCKNSFSLVSRSCRQEKELTRKYIRRINDIEL